MAEGGDTRPHGESYMKAIWGHGDLVYDCDGGWLKIIYNEHEFVILPRPRGVYR